MNNTKPATLPRRRFLLNLAFALCFLASSVRAAADLPATQTAAGVPEKAVRVACVGDSITFGSGIKNRQNESYPAVLGRLLSAGWEVRNFGVSGATVLHKADKPYLKQKAHSDALAFAPDILVIMLGTNDSKHRGHGNETNAVANNWQYQADYVPDYERLIAEFRKANPSVKVYVCLPTPCFPGRWGINDQTIHDEIIPMIRQVAQTSNAIIIDLNSALAGRQDLFPDTVHPNTAGAKLMAETVYQALTGNAATAQAK